MPCPNALFATVFVALYVDATPTIQIRDPPANINLPFALKLNVSGTTLPELDRARVAAMVEHVQGPDPDQKGKRADPSSFPVTNDAVSYVTTVGIGSPPTPYTLLIDTGSSNTWIGSGQNYSKTSASRNTGQTVSVTYGSGSFSGDEYTDTVTLSDSLVISNQSIGVATTSKGFDGVDGILGIGPTSLTSDTVKGSGTVPTVTDNLASQGKIPAPIIGISFSPTTATSAQNGELTFGGTDSGKFTGQITYAPITQHGPASKFWGIEQTISYGAPSGSGSTTVLKQTSGIVDTGTTLVLLASDAFAQYRQLTGAEPDSKSGLLKIPNEQYGNLKSLFFAVGGTNFELTANAQTWPRALNQYIGGDSNSTYLIVGDLGTNSGRGLDFVNGYAFLERFYSVYDTANKRVGLATTENTMSTSN